MDFDVIVVGAGPGGCVAARNLARLDMNVGLFDANDRDKVGNTIIIEAEKAMFKTVDVDPPKADEIPYHPLRVRVFSPRGVEAFTLDKEPPSIALFLDKFVQRLLRDAIDAGVKFFDGHKATGPVISEGRVQGVTFEHKGIKQEARASLVIDATGFNASLVSKLDPEMGIEFPRRKSDIVIAENYYHEIDPVAAEDAIKDRRHLDEEIWIRIGFAGPYSTEFSHLSMKNKRAYILIGKKADHDGPPVADYVERFRERQGYYGEQLHGGGGPICISHSLDKLVADGFMVIGEAASQVIPAHGSGVASALYAGRLASNAAAQALKDGEPTTAALWPYCRQYQSGRGGVLAAMNVTRLMVDSFAENIITPMLESGVMQSEDLYNAGIPKATAMSISSIPRRLKGLLKSPQLILPLAKMSRLALQVQKHYSKYPRQYDPDSFASWKRKANSCF